MLANAPAVHHEAAAMTADPQRPGVAIVGFPRSGTTLLRRLLNAHPDLDAPGESYLLSACARFVHGDRVIDGVEAGGAAGDGRTARFGRQPSVTGLLFRAPSPSCTIRARPPARAFQGT